MSTIKIAYKGGLRTLCAHENGSSLTTDGPIELQGKGENFSPTDLFAASLPSCMLTLMGLCAKKLKLELSGTSATVEKQMSKTPPRRIAVLKVIITSPLNPDDAQKKQLEEAAINCPVHLSLHPDIEQTIEFKWNSK